MHTGLILGHPACSAIARTRLMS